MDYFSIVLLAFGLSFDSFAVSVCSGMSMCRKHLKLRDALKIAGSLAFFQALMPVLGWVLGSTVKVYIESYDHWIALILLSVLGVRMIIEGLKPHNEKVRNPTSWKTIITMSVATSIDALAVGISFAFLIDNMLFPSLIIGAVTFGVAISGIYMGRKTGKLLAGKAEILGGIILIVIGLKIVLEHTGYL